MLTLELSEQAVAFTESRRSQLRQETEQPHIYKINLKSRQIIAGSHRHSKNFVNLLKKTVDFGRVSMYNIIRTLLESTHNLAESLIKWGFIDYSEIKVQAVTFIEKGGLL